MLLSLPKIYPLTDRGLARMSHAEQVSKLIQGGASFIQLREKTLPAFPFYEDAKAALSVARQHGAKIIINDRVDLALVLGVDGVHLGQDDLPPEQVRRLLGPQSIIGFSTHSVEQAKDALRHPIDYLAIGPIFATETKTDTAPVVGLHGLSEVKAIAETIPVVAIGGITETRIADVLDAGADTVAVISSILQNPATIVSTTQRLLTRHCVAGP
jgi:thiamine-phosphate pyrophosphorylase